MQGAQKQLRAVAAGSVYFNIVNAAFRSAEDKAVDEVRSKAMGFTVNHDCAGLRDFQVKIAAVSTTAVNAAAMAQCVDQPNSRPLIASQPSSMEAQAQHPVQVIDCATAARRR